MYGGKGTHSSCKILVSAYSLSSEVEAENEIAYHLSPWRRRKCWLADVPSVHCSISKMKLVVRASGG